MSFRKDSLAGMGGVLFLAALCSAQIPQTLDFQGRLTDATGQPVADGSHGVTFRLHDSETLGNLLWGETQTVETSNGFFSAVLGQGVPLDPPARTLSDLEFDRPLWLSLQVDGDPEMSPRIRLTSAATALNADRLDGLDSTEFLRTTGGTLSGGLSAAGEIESTSGGFRFPDGTLQTTSASAAADLDPFLLEQLQAIYRAQNLEAGRSLTPTLTWDAVPGADHYEVEVLQADGALHEAITTPDSTPEAMVTIPLTEGASYTFRVRPVSASGTAGTFTTSAPFTAVATQPIANAFLGRPVEMTAAWSGAAHLHDGDDATISGDQLHTGGTQRVTFDLGDAEAVVEYRILGGPNHPVAWTLSGSNDFSSWTELDARSAQDTSTAKVYSLANATAYRYYQFHVTQYPSDELRIKTIELHSSPGGPDIARVGQAIAGFGPIFLGGTYLSDGDPSTQGGEGFHSGNFDLIVSTHDPVWLEDYSLTWSAGGAPQRWTFQGSNDLSNWTTLHSPGSDQSFSSQVPNTYSIADQSRAYQYFRLQITKATSDEPHLAEIAGSGEF